MILVDKDTGERHTLTTDPTVSGWLSGVSGSDDNINIESEFGYLSANSDTINYWQDIAERKEDIEHRLRRLSDKWNIDIKILRIMLDVHNYNDLKDYLAAFSMEFELVEHMIDTLETEHWTFERSSSMPKWYHVVKGKYDRACIVSGSNPNNEWFAVNGKEGLLKFYEVCMGSPKAHYRLEHIERVGDTLYLKESLREVEKDGCIEYEVREDSKEATLQDFCLMGL
jgi:hypothetical protein